MRRKKSKEDFNRRSSLKFPSKKSGQQGQTLSRSSSFSEKIVLDDIKSSNAVYSNDDDNSMAHSSILLDKDVSLLIQPPTEVSDAQINDDDDNNNNTAVGTKYVSKRKNNASMLSGQEAQAQLIEMMNRENSEFIMQTESLNRSTRTLDLVKKKIRNFHLKNEKIDPIRHPIRYEIAMHYFTIDYASTEISRIRSNFMRYGMILNRITQMMTQKQSNTNSVPNHAPSSAPNHAPSSAPNHAPNPVPNPPHNSMPNSAHNSASNSVSQCYVDITAYVNDFIKSADSSLMNFKVRRSTFQKFFQPLVPIPPNPCDKEGFLLSTQNKSGRIIEKFKVQVELLSFADLDVIADALFELDSNLFDTKDEIVQILFDVAWTIKKYPILPHGKVNTFWIPYISDLIPKIFNPPFLAEEFKMMTFQQLSALQNWPLKAAVDSLFDIMLMTNPFEIAKCFSKTIQLVGEGVQKMINAENPNDVDIDFDQLFVLLIICIFTSGLSNITEPMSYAFQFSEYVEEPEIQFAMSHMEGLCAHFPKMNFKELREKSHVLQAQK